VSIAHARIAASGVISFTATLPGAGRLVVVATVSHPRTTASLDVLAPGAGHVFARRTLSLKAGTTRGVTASPLAGTARVKRLRRRRAVAITLRITFTPSAGAASHAGVAVSLPAGAGRRG
jgi:hypothetical protein